MTFANRLTPTLIVLFSVALGLAPAGARKAPVPQAAVPKAAAQRIPIAFTAPHGYTAAVDYLKKLAAANPGLTDLVEIGRSRADKPIYVLVVSNMKTGVTMDRLVPLQHPRTPAVNNVRPMKPYEGKPGQWMDGGRHGGDLAGTAACLYAADKLVAGYGADAEITRLVDDNAFYICPVVNPDAAGGEGTRSAAAEASLNDNYPEGWWTDDNTPGGSGDYPSSSPEARAVLEFFTNHTNILLVQSFDRTGGRAVRPFARWPEGRVDARDTAVLDGVLGKKYQELAGQAAGPQTWRAAYNADRQAPAAYGTFYDWAYGQFGAYAVTIQLSDAQAPATGVSLEKLCELAWQFERYKATLLPQVRVKEASAKVLYTTNSASKASANESDGTVVVKRSGTPGRYKIVQVSATVENGGALPTQVARGTQLRGNRQDVVWLLGDPSKVTFLEGSRWMPLGVLQGTLPLPRATAAEGARGGRAGGPGGGRGGRGGQAAGAPLSQMREQRPATFEGRQSGSSRTVSWLIAVEGDTPLKLALTSQKGGTTVKELAVQ